MKQLSETEFLHEADAIEACNEINKTLRHRSNGNTIAFRNGKRVWIRPEYASQRAFYELAVIREAFD